MTHTDTPGPSDSPTPEPSDSPSPVAIDAANASGAALLVWFVWLAVGAAAAALGLGIWWIRHRRRTPRIIGRSVYRSRVDSAPAIDDTQQF